MRDVEPSRDYVWHGLDAAGRHCLGRISAGSTEQAYARLQAQGLLLLGLERSRRRPPTLPAAARAEFYRQLATLLAAGLPLLQALASLRTSAATACASGLVQQLVSGDSLAAAMRRQPRCFPAWDCALVSAAERSGELDDGLLRLAEQTTSELALRVKVRAALRYPLAVLAVAAAVFVFIMSAVVPTFESLALQHATPLPLPTRLLLSLSAMLRQPWSWLLALPLALLAAAARPLLACLPPFAALDRLRALAVWCRLLGSLTAAGLPLLDALAELAAAPALGPLAACSTRLQQGVAGGASLLRAMQREALLPPLLLELVEVGEQAGCLPALLERASSVFQQQLEQRLQGLASLLEPLLLVALGAFSAVLLSSIYWPLLRLGQVLG